MAIVRSAILLATGDRYLGIIIGLGTWALLARLLTPEQIGIYAIGNSIILAAAGMRQFVTPDFLIQRPTVEQVEVRSSFTVLLLASLALALALGGSSLFVARFYDHAELASYLQVASLSLILDAVGMPIVALLRREMKFGVVAIISTVSAIASSGAIVAGALLGWGVLSFAIGAVVASVATSVVALWNRPDLSVFRPSLKSWRVVGSFGGYSGVTVVLDRLYESIPNLLMGFLLPANVVGHFSRANMICNIPDRLVLGGAYAVAFPAIGMQARAGGDLAQPYLRSLAVVTAFHWPALVVLAILAVPVVHIVLGPQWDAVVLLVQILCIANLGWFPVIFTQPVLLGIGRTRETLNVALLTRPTAGVILCAAVPFGVIAVALSQFLTIPLQSWLSIHFVKKYVSFTWGELARAVLPSAIVTGFTIVGPLLMAASKGMRLDFTFLEAVVAGLLAGIGWLLSIWVTGHPVFQELKAMYGDLRVGMNRRGLGRVAIDKGI